MTARRKIVATVGAVGLAAGMAGTAVAQLNPAAGNGGTGGNGSNGGNGAPATNVNTNACTSVNNGTTNIVAHTKTSCGKASNKASIRNAGNGGQGGNRGKGGRGGHALQRLLRERTTHPRPTREQ